MDINVKIRYQQDCLQSHEYINYLWKIINEEVDIDITVEEKEIYVKHLPINFQNFLSECNSLLINSNSERINFDFVDKKYIVALIYTGLTDEDDATATESANLFLILNTYDNDDLLNLNNMFNLDDTAFNFLFRKVLKSFGDKINDDSKITIDSIIYITKLITKTKHDVYYIKIFANDLYKLMRNVSTESRQIWDGYEAAVFEFHRCVVDKFIGIGDFHMVVNIARLYMKGRGQRRIESFRLKIFRDIIHPLHRTNFVDSYIRLICALAIYCDSIDFYINVLNEVPTLEVYNKIVNVIINTFVKYNVYRIQSIYLELLAGIIRKAYTKQNEHRVRQKIVQRIVREVYMKCLTTVEEQMKFQKQTMLVFIEWFDMLDFHLVQSIQDLVYSDTYINTVALIERMKEGVDMHWKTKEYNCVFIKFVSKLSAISHRIMPKGLMQFLDMLCSKATAVCIKGCVPELIHLFKGLVMSEHSAMMVILRILIKHMLSPTDVSSYYIKEVFALIANAFIADKDNEKEFFIINSMLDDDLDPKGIFKLFVSHNLIGGKQLGVLFNEKTLKSAIAFKLLNLLIDFVDYNEFPKYMLCERPMDDLVMFCASPESLDHIQVLYKIFTRKINQNSVNQADNTFAKNLEITLIKLTNEYLFPAAHIDSVLILCHRLAKITHSDTKWVNELFENCMCSITDKSKYAENGILIERKLAYMAGVIIYFDVELKDVQIKALDNLMEPIEQFGLGKISEVLWHRFVTLYGSICLKSPEKIMNDSSCIKKLLYAFTEGDQFVKQSAMHILYDICNVHTRDFTCMEVGLFNILQSDDTETKYGASKIILRLVNDESIRLNASHFIILMSVLISRDAKISKLFKELLDQRFIHSNELTISKYFVHFLLYLNKYEEHPMFALCDIEINSQLEYSPEKRIFAYKVLFMNLPNMSQFYILRILNQEILVHICSGKLSLTGTVSNILRDILALFYMVIEQRLTKGVFQNVDEFYITFIREIKKEFFQKRTPLAEMDSVNVIDNLMTTLLNMLYKFVHVNADFVPLLFIIVVLATKAFYNMVLGAVAKSCSLRTLYFDLDSFYNKHKQIILLEPFKSFAASVSTVSVVE